MRRRRPRRGHRPSTHVDPGTAVTWEAPAARNRWLGVTFTSGEGVTWRIDPHGGGTTRLSAHVWAVSPAGAAGRILQTAFARVLNGVERDREHTRIELRYLKDTLEAESHGR